MGPGENSFDHCIVILYNESMTNTTTATDAFWAGYADGFRYGRCGGRDFGALDTDYVRGIGAGQDDRREGRSPAGPELVR